MTIAGQSPGPLVQDLRSIPFLFGCPPGRRRDAARFFRHRPAAQGRLYFPFSAVPS
ncbi:hypothetical protein BSLA_03r1636 [Burkholderia stabilis]|nr:hypothetical protein BSLA_03r1636 [Burkholderia stabilis]